MERRLSKTHIASFCGDVVPLRLLGGEPYSLDPITWRSEGGSVLLKSYADDPEPFTDGVLLTLMKPGKASVTATFEGKDYVCSIEVREARTAKPGEKLNYYVGDLHVHTYNKHKKEVFIAREEKDYPRNCIEQVKKENLLDFSVVSDHSDMLNPREFFRGFADAEDAQPMELIVFSGSESEVDVFEYDRYGVRHKNSGEIVTLNCTAYPKVKTWDEYFDQLQDSPFAVCAFCHPQGSVSSVPGGWDFCLEKNNDRRFLDRMHLIATGDGTDRNANINHEYVYSVALDAGYKISPTSSSDSHGPVWGYYRVPGKTVIMAPEKSKDAFLDAIKHNRVYATGSGNVKLAYEVNGCPAPATLPLTDEYKFKVHIGYFHENPMTQIVKCQVVSNGGEYVETLDCLGQDELEFTIRSSEARYFYLRLVDRVGSKTFSCPVWTGRPPIVEPEPAPLAPLDKKGFTAVDEESGADASVLVNDDITKSFVSEKPTCAVVIDMHREETISALSHYPRHVSRQQMLDAGMIAPWYIREFPRAYRLSTSVDGESYTLQKEGAFRNFVNETFLRFPETKARYIKLEILSTVGKESERKDFALSHVAMAELTVWKNA